MEGTTNTKNDPDILANIAEVKLLELGRPSIRALQFLGYLPLTILKSQNLRLQPWSLPFLTPILLECISLYFKIHVLLDWAEFWEVYRRIGGTEAASMHAVCNLAGITLFLYRACGLLRSRRTLQFWGSNVCLLQSFIKRGYNIWSGDHGGVLDRVKGSIRRGTLLTLGIIASFWIYSFGFGVWLYFTLPEPEGFVFNLFSPPDQKGRLHNFLPSKGLILGQFYIFFYAYLHVLYVSWIGLFLKLYAGFIRMIDLEFRVICRGNNSCTRRSSQGQGGFGYGRVTPCSRRSTATNDYHNSNGSGGDSYPNSRTSFSKVPFSPQTELLLQTRVFDLFNEVTDQIETFNSYFGFSLVFEVAACCLNIVLYDFFGFIWLLQGKEHIWKYILVAIPLHLYIKELWELGNDGTRIVTSARAMVQNFHNVFDLPISHSLQKKMELLAIRVGTNPPVVTAANLFQITRTLLTSIACGLTTYLVILLQFRDSEKGDSQEGGINSNENISLPSVIIVGGNSTL